MTVVLFLAVCVYGGAALYARLRPGEAAVVEVIAASGIRLSGIALRSEAAFFLPDSAELLVRDNERVPAGGALARLADGSLITAEHPVLYRSDADGLEALSPDALEDLDVSTLQALFDRPAQDLAGCRGRLIADSAWQFACLAPAETALSTGSFCRLRFSGQSGLFRARLIRQSAASRGQVALVFRLTAGGEVLSLRRCEAELITRS